MRKLVDKDIREAVDKIQAAGMGEFLTQELKAMSPGPGPGSRLSGRSRRSDCSRRSGRSRRT
jgi:hypothetical protein